MPGYGYGLGLGWRKPIGRRKTARLRREPGMGANALGVGSTILPMPAGFGRATTG